MRKRGGVVASSVLLLSHSNTTGLGAFCAGEKFMGAMERWGVNVSVCVCCVVPVRGDEMRAEMWGFLWV